ncbi:MAG: hypothetical protein WBG01_10455 [Bacteroidota bacterium]
MEIVPTGLEPPVAGTDWIDADLAAADSIGATFAILVEKPIRRSRNT